MRRVRAAPARVVLAALAAQTRELSCLHRLATL